MKYTVSQRSGVYRFFACIVACLLLATGCAVKEQKIEALVYPSSTPAPASVSSAATAASADSSGDLLGIYESTGNASAHLIASSKDVKLISPYGPRRSGKRTRMHRGLDIKAPKGTAVLAYTSGDVIVAGKRRGYGLSVDVRHADGIVSRYAHMSKISVKRGERVAAGKPVGAVGQTGRATTAHLHFEMLKNGKAVNPTSYLKRGFDMVLSTDTPVRAYASVSKSTASHKKNVQKSQQSKRKTKAKSTGRVNNKKTTPTKTARASSSPAKQASKKIISTAQAPKTNRPLGKATTQSQKLSLQQRQAAPQASKVASNAKQASRNTVTRAPQAAAPKKTSSQASASKTKATQTALPRKTASPRKTGSPHSPSQAQKASR